MILSHEKNTVIDALEFYCQFQNDREDKIIAVNTANNVLARLKAEHLPVGAFCHGDYQSHAKDCGYDLTDDQVNDLSRDVKLN